MIKEDPEAAKRHMQIRPDWLALVEEAPLEPELAIIDPHHHLWDKPGERYLMPDLLEDLACDHNILATVFLECRAMYRNWGEGDLRPVGETEFVAGVAAMSESGNYGPTHICAGIVGHADLTLGDKVGRVLDALAVAGGGRLRGIRNSTTSHADPAARGSLVNRPAGMLLDRRFREGFAHLARHQLCFDSWIYHTQIDELTDLARAFPDTTIVLNHVGGVLGIGPYQGRRDEVFEEWKRSLGKLAGCANVRVKLGGLGMRLFGFDFQERPRPPTSAELAAAWGPYIETSIALFGPERAMFESNFPVDKGTCSYAVLWNAFKRIAQSYSANEKAALFCETARRTYRL